MPDIDEIMAIVSATPEQAPKAEYPLKQTKLETTTPNKPDSKPESNPPKDQAAPKFPDIEETLAAVEAQNQTKFEQTDNSPLLVHNPLHAKVSHKPLYLTLLMLLGIGFSVAYYVYTEIQQLNSSPFALSSTPKLSSERKTLQARLRTPAVTMPTKPIETEEKAAPVDSISIAPVPPLPEAAPSSKPIVEPTPAAPEKQPNPMPAQTLEPVAEPVPSVPKPSEKDSLLNSVLAMVLKPKPNDNTNPTKASTKTITTETQAAPDLHKITPEPIPETARVTVHPAQTDLQQQESYRLLKQAYHAYLQRDDTSAALYYSDALKLSPNNYDALIGIATISARSGQKEQAKYHYQRLLSHYPGDIYAEVGLIMSDEENNADAQWQQQVVKIKKKIKHNPSASHLHALLGHLYMRRQHWDMAKEAYFEAYRFDDQNPDYAFDLAVSLEKLSQADAALRYYQIARGLAVAGQEVSFSPETIEKRIHSLETQNP